MDTVTGRCNDQMVTKMSSVQLTVITHSRPVFHKPGEDTRQRQPYRFCTNFVLKLWGPL